MVEAHGTSTALGDSIEASAIIETFKGRPAHLPLVVSSSKSVFGHTEEAAGIVGVLKALLCLRRGWAPP
ncbi:coronafacic acid polyketide synthase I, partial [Violaceomyces palustris]